jgi:hypothetical protein
MRGRWSTDAAAATGAGADAGAGADTGVAVSAALLRSRLGVYPNPSPHQQPLHFFSFPKSNQVAGHTPHAGQG